MSETIVITKSCLLCEGIEQTEWFNNVPNKPETFTEFPHPKEGFPNRKVNLCEDCLAVISAVCDLRIKENEIKEKEPKGRGRPKGSKSKKKD